MGKFFLSVFLELSDELFDKIYLYIDIVLIVYMFCEKIFKGWFEKIIKKGKCP